MIAGRDRRRHLRVAFVALIVFVSLFFKYFSGVFSVSRICRFQTYSIFLLFKHRIGWAFFDDFTGYVFQHSENFLEKFPERLDFEEKML